jgi:hypothetical protein
MACHRGVRRYQPAFPSLNGIAAPEGSRMEPMRPAEATSALRLVALAALRGGRVLLVIPGATCWRAESGYTLVPLELPGGIAEESEADEQALARVVRVSLGVGCRLGATGWTYAPSARHAVDRAAAPRGRRAPLAETTRLLPANAGHPVPRPLVARIYRGELLAEPRPAMCAAALWLTPGALRAVVRGLPFNELRARTDVRWNALGGGQPPADALIYLPSEYGERYLLRAAAKYGAQALFGTDAVDEDE